MRGPGILSSFLLNSAVGISHDDCVGDDSFLYVNEEEKAVIFMLMTGSANGKTTTKCSLKFQFPINQFTSFLYHKN